MPTGSLNYIELRTLTGGHPGIIDVACPLCGPECRAAINRKREVLRIWDDGDFITYKCARCPAKGWAKPDRAAVYEPAARPKRVAPPAQDRAEIARFLWDKAEPFVGSLAEKYLAVRRCCISSPALRFLPGGSKYAPAMIARFGDGAVTGVHLTKLQADGSGKAGTAKDKIMIGPSMGQPIMLWSSADSSDLVIAEGNEDGASLALCRDWSVWVAGSAGRMAQITDKAAEFERVYFALDNDKAGHAALVHAQAVRPDVIPLNFAKALGIADCLDANKALLKYGSDAVSATIDWSAAKAAFATKQITFHQMLREISLAEGVFRRIASSL
jgi:hypothetical protein